VRLDIIWRPALPVKVPEVFEDLFQLTCAVRHRLIVAGVVNKELVGG